MSTVDRLIDLKDSGVSLAHEVQAAFKSVGDDVAHFDVPGVTARRLLALAEGVIETQAEHDKENERELEDTPVAGDMIRTHLEREIKKIEPGEEQEMGDEGKIVGYHGPGEGWYIWDDGDRYNYDRISDVIDEIL